MRFRDFVFLAFLLHKNPPADSAKYTRSGEKMAQTVLAHPLCFLFCILAFFLGGYMFMKGCNIAGWVILALIPVSISLSVDRLYAWRRIDYILHPAGFECFCVSFFCFCYSHKTIGFALLFLGILFSFVIPFQIHKHLLNQEIKKNKNDSTSLSPASASSKVQEPADHTKNESLPDSTPWDW